MNKKEFEQKFDAIISEKRKNVIVYLKNDTDILSSSYSYFSIDNDNQVRIYDKGGECEDCDCADCEWVINFNEIDRLEAED